MTYANANGNGRRADYDAIVVGDGLAKTGIRTRETIETVGGAVVVSAGATVVATGEDGAPRPLTGPEREALQR